MALPPYPTDFPSEAFMLVLDKVRGRADVSGPDLAHAGWCVAGYALGQTLGGGPTIRGAENLEQVGWSDDQILQGAIEANDGAKGALFPWVLVVRVAVKLILEAVL